MTKREDEYRLETDGFIGYVDPVKDIAFVLYDGALTPQVTARAYEWLDTILAEREPARGSVFDFQRVTRVENSNISSAQRQSQTLNKNHDMSRIPVALIVNNEYKAQMMGLSLRMTPQQERKRVVRSIDEGFKFITTFQQSHQMPLSVPIVAADDASQPVTPDTTETAAVSVDFNVPHATAYFDTQTRVVEVTYYGHITGDVTRDVYGWMMGQAKIYGIETIRGGKFDFRQVTKFDNTNLRTVKQSSSNMNRAYDMSHIAVALITSTAAQEQMVSIGMQVTPQEQRKRLVRSAQEAYHFIDEYEQQYAKRIATSSVSTPEAD